MIVDLVTIEDARAQIRIDDVDSDGGPDDTWLVMAIPAVSYAIASWVKDHWRLYALELDSNGDVVLDSDEDPVVALDSDGEPTVLPQVRLAALIELAHEYRYREGEGPRMESLGAIINFSAQGYVLGPGTTSLLTALRKPTVS